MGRPWIRLAWQRHVASPTVPGGLATLERVCARYREPQRHYHTLDHLNSVLGHLADFQHPDIDARLANAAGFYHDAVYDPRRPHDLPPNEVASAQLARRHLGALGWADRELALVEAMIEATIDHDSGGDITTAALLCADLGVLAAAPSSYDAYRQRVRREYCHLDDAAWCAGRTEALMKLLHRTAIFDERVVPPDWEQRARANISAELASLSR